MSRALLAWAPLPEVGSTWRERRRAYSRRVVRVVDADEHFITIDSLRTTSGEPPKRPVRTQVRRTLWHYTFEPANEVPV